MSEPIVESSQSGGVSDFGNVHAEYDAIQQAAAVIDLGCRDRIEVTGADRASFLHNLCTNEIRKLPIGSGCEAFFLNVQGKILAHTLVLCRPESLVVETVGGAAPVLLEHLERYHIREAVELQNRTADWSELFVAGLNTARSLTWKSGRISLEQIATLRQRLNESRAPYKVVVTHHPFIPPPIAGS